jgi:hypothetical protein
MLRRFIPLALCASLAALIGAGNAAARDASAYRAEAARAANAKKAETGNITRQARTASQATVKNANKTAQQSQQAADKAVQNVPPGQTLRVGNTSPDNEQTATPGSTSRITVGNIVQTQDEPGTQSMEIGRGISPDRIKTGNIIQSGNTRIIIGTPAEPRPTPEQAPVGP